MTASPSPAGPRPLLLARVTSVRFAAYYLMTLGAGLGAHRLGDPVVLLLAVGYCLAFCVAVESLNRLTDRVEDEINQPLRTAMCLRVGYPAVQAVCVAAWAVVVVLDVAWVLAVPRAELAVLLVVNLVVGMGYSAGPRLKGRPLAALLVLTGTLSLPLLTGYLTFPDRGRLAAVLTSAAVLVLFSLTTAGAKDLTDEAGDAARDYRSLWLLVLRRRRGLLAALVGLQVVVVLLALWPGPLPAWSLLALVVVPLEVAVLVCVARARSAREKAAAREAMHTSTLLAVGSVLIATQPSLPTVALVVGGWGWWAAASRLLHWNRSLSRSSWVACRSLLVPGLTSGHHRTSAHG